MVVTAALEHEVVIIGCGFAGIGMGIELLRRGITSFAILEAADDVGGTWRDNRYPGVAVDIPSFTYSFSFAQQSSWSRMFAPGDELKRYADHCTDRFRLRPHLRFGARVESAEYQEATGTWELRLANGDTVCARYVISATGLLHAPKLPAIPGLESFRGQAMHSARWRDDVALDGARVALIGTGASAVQLVPALRRRVAHLTVFQRTPPWVLPKPDAAISPLVQQLLRRVPLLQAACRAGTSAGTELLLVLAIVYNRQFPWLVRMAELICKAHLRAQVQDKALRQKLQPRYGFGCNRPTFSNEYLASFNSPHVTLESGGASQVVHDGVITADGRHVPADVLIYATGFRTYERGNLPSYAVHGRDGVELGAHWEENRFQAYHGASVPGFPNHFLMVGPYTATGASWFSIVENQARHIGRCISHAKRHGFRVVEVSEPAHKRFFAAIQRRLPNTVFFNNSCGASNSYYFDKHGDALFYRPSSGLEAYVYSHVSPLSDYRFA